VERDATLRHAVTRRRRPPAQIDLWRASVTEQVVELLDTQDFFGLLKLPYPPDRGGVIDRLQRERLVEPAAGGFAIRLLGAPARAAASRLPRPIEEGTAGI
jgi:hypothetical protein